jgi:hypothetical protein
MKSFNSLQELWSYSLYCPVCKNMDRRIDLSIGMDDCFRLIEFRKINQILTIIMERPQEKNIRAKVEIDCVTNAASRYVYDTLGNPAKEHVTFMTVSTFSTCDDCGSVTNSEDFIVNFMTYDIHLPIHLENEFIVLNDKKANNRLYSVNFLHLEEFVEISVFDKTQESRRPLSVPMFDLDLSNIDKALKRIKTIVLFS